MEPKNGGFEDDYPFQLGDFLVPEVHFQGWRFVAQIHWITYGRTPTSAAFCSSACCVAIVAFSAFCQGAKYEDELILLVKRHQESSRKKIADTYSINHIMIYPPWN